jgi:flagellar motor switch protein FliM
VSATGSHAPAPPAPSGSRRHAGPQPYDFRRPNKFNRDHVRALQIVSETFARQLTTVIATTLRAVSTVTLGAVEQMTYDEYIRSVPNPSYLAILALDPLPGAAMLQIPLTIATAAIDRMLGGRGDVLDTLRPLTEIEESLMRTLTDRALRELVYAFESLVKLEPQIMSQESNAQFAQITTPSDMTLTIVLDMKIAEARDRATLCIPYDTLAPVLDTLAGESLFAGRGGNAAMFATNLHDAIEDVPIDVSVRFNPVTLTSAEILGLEVGDVVPLRHLVNEPLVVTVGGTAAYRATTGRNGKRLACRIVSTDGP